MKMDWGNRFRAALAAGQFRPARAHEEEWMDLPGQDPALLAECLDDLRRVNRWIGGVRLSIRALEGLPTRPARRRRTPWPPTPRSRRHRPRPSSAPTLPPSSSMLHPNTSARTDGLPLATHQPLRLFGGEVGPPRRSHATTPHRA